MFSKSLFNGLKQYRYTDDNSKKEYVNHATKNCARSALKMFFLLEFIWSNCSKKTYRSNIKCLSTIVFNYILLVIFFGPDRKGGKITKKLPPFCETIFFSNSQTGVVAGYNPGLRFSFFKWNADF